MAQEQVELDPAEILKHLGTDAPEEIQTMATQLADNVLKQGMTPKEALKVSQDMIEALYGYAYRLYNSGNYKDAIKIFQMLHMLDPSEKRFLLGLAGSHHHIEAFNSAVLNYTLLAMMDGADPIPHYHMADCLMRLGAKSAAIESLKKVMELSKDQEQHSVLHAQAESMVASLEKKQK